MENDLRCCALLFVSVALSSAAGANLMKNPSFEADEMPFRLERFEVGWEKLKTFDDARYRARPDVAHYKDGTRAYYLGCDNPTGRQLLKFPSLPVGQGREKTRALVTALLPTGLGPLPDPAELLKLRRTLADALEQKGWFDWLF